MASAVTTVTVRAPRPPRSDTHFTVSSATFSPDGLLPRETVFGGCGGDNQSPQLTWHDAPSGTRSFAITCFDPDAPTGSGYWHWLTWDIPADVTSLPMGAGTDGSPAGGTSGYTDYGISSYGGPCPPAGDAAHRYIFTVYALDVPTLDGLGAGTTGATLVFNMMGHVLATGTLTGRFAVDHR
jgi:Raf kinase inhibitor-like YbhB/YbcL family protein